MEPGPVVETPLHGRPGAPPSSRRTRRFTLLAGAPQGLSLCRPIYRFPFQLLMTMWTSCAPSRSIGSAGSYGCMGSMARAMTREGGKEGELTNGGASAAGRRVRGERQEGSEEMRVPGKGCTRYGGRADYVGCMALNTLAVTPVPPSSSLRKKRCRRRCGVAGVIGRSRGIWVVEGDCCVTAVLRGLLEGKWLLSNRVLEFRLAAQRLAKTPARIQIAEHGLGDQPHRIGVFRPVELTLAGHQMPQGVSKPKQIRLSLAHGRKPSLKFSGRSGNEQIICNPCARELPGPWPRRSNA